MADAPPSIHIFHRNMRVFGYTADKSGANLPALDSAVPWVFLTTMDPNPDNLPITGPQMPAIREGIERDGFYLADGVITVRRTVVSAPATL